MDVMEQMMGRDEGEGGRDQEAEGKRPEGQGLNTKCE
jgi:hypothetical protein